MKTKIILAFLCLLCNISPLLAQRIVNETYAWQPGKKVNLNLGIADSIRVEAWNRNEISLEAVVTINNNKLNEALVFDVENQAGELRLKASFNEVLLGRADTIDCPQNSNNMQVFTKAKQGYKSVNIVCSSISYRLRMPAQAELQLKSINGNITIVGLTGPIEAKSVSGFVDMSWPANQEAAFSLRSINGEVYSDLPIEIKENKKNVAHPVGHQLKGALASGNGPLIRLESISNDVYLRKRK